MWSSSFPKKPTQQSSKPKSKSSLTKRERRRNRVRLWLDERRSNPVWTPDFVRPISRPDADGEESELELRQQIMFLLIGLPGSGKSTFAHSLEKAMPWRYHRINQDSTSCRKKCEADCRQSLAYGNSVIIDRCNYDVSQRRSFINIAQEFKIPVDVVVFTVSAEECIKRCQKRSFHETIDPRSAVRAVRFIESKMCMPEKEDEGIRSIFSISTIKESNDMIKKYTINVVKSEEK